MPLPVAAWLVLCLIWGSTWLFIKLGLADLPPISFAGLRFVVASAVLWGIVAIRKAPLPKGFRAWGYLALTGFLAFSVNYGLLFWGEERTSSGLAAVLQATIPAFGLVTAHFLLPADRMTLPKVSGVALGIAGVAVIFSDRATLAGPDALRGGLAIVGGAFAVALSNVLVKARGGSFDPLILAAVQMSFGLVPLVAAGFVLEGSPLAFRWTPRAVVSLLYLALVGSVVAFLLFYWLLRRMDVTKVLLIALVTPVLAVALGAAVLGERLGPRAFLGTAMILAGVFVGTRRPAASGRA
ncbi:MAG: EamA family transporter [Thermoanaerobaculia bacterium]|nr:EamA family transporter [Thermoanaerobaculia bacterium]